ncbi:MAG: helix-turn-helix domain-containing protein [Candidatus Azobacteroides sp.]|nr:helix-turn-helix domain-containing protein [Candidatus Azobacteroides sp.]
MFAIDSNAFRIIALEKIDQTFLASLALMKEKSIEMILVTSGYLVREHRAKEVRINPKDFHLAISQQPIVIRETGGDLQGWYCRFTTAFLDGIYVREDLENEAELIGSFLHQYPLRLSNRVFQRLAFHFDSLTRLFEEEAKDYSLMHAYVAVCIYEIKKMMRENSLDFYPVKAFSIAKQYNDLLASYIEKEQSPKFYAGMLQITPNHLNKSVKSVTGKTAMALLNEARLIEIKSRLKNTDLSICEIAYQLGFDDPSYFSRFFRKAAGCSPAKFRKTKTNR